MKGLFKLLASGALGGSPFSAEIQAVIAKANSDGATKPQDNVMLIYDQYLIQALKNSVIIPWSGWLTMNFYGFGSKEFGSINLISPLLYQNTFPVAPEFHTPSSESDPYGIRSAASGYINSNFYTDEFANIQNLLTTILDVSESDTNTQNGYAFGGRTLAAGATNTYNLRPKPSTNIEISNYTTNSTAANADHQGLYITTKSGGNLVVYKDAATIFNGAKTFTAPDLHNSVFFLTQNTHATGGLTPSANYYTKYCRLFARYNGNWTVEMRDEFRTIYNNFLSEVSDAFFFSVGIGEMEIGSSFVIR